MTALHNLLTPALALIVWSLVVWVWMYATRIPAINKAGINPATAREKSALDALPLTVRQVADNYNHLMEQPTIFYALAFYGQIPASMTASASPSHGVTWACGWFTAWSRPQ